MKEVIPSLSAPCKTALLLTAALLSSALSDDVSQPLEDHLITEAGHNVTLLCRAPVIAAIIAAEWSRRDLGSQYVFLYRNKRSDTTYQHPLFENRVQLADSQLKDGNVSLLLNNATSNDTGTYECRVKQGTTTRMNRAVLKSDPVCTIHLTVTQSQPGLRAGNGAGGIPGGHVGLFLALSVKLIF